MKRNRILSVALVLVAAGCEAEGDDGHPLQSLCVQEHFGTTRTIPDGYGCSNFGYTDCGGVFASDCLHYCAFDACQAVGRTSLKA